MLAVVRGCDEGRGVARLRVVLLGARGRALGGGSSAPLGSLAKVATDAGVGGAPGATASVRRGEERVQARALRQGGVRPPVSPGGGAGLTLAWAEALDSDVQALTAGDGPQLTLIAVGESIRPTDLGGTAQGCLGSPSPRLQHPPTHTCPAPHLGSIGPQTGGCWAHTVGRASVLHAGCPKLTVHLSAGLGCQGVWGIDMGDPMRPRPQHKEPHQHQAWPSPGSQPAGPRARPPGHCPHLGPATPGLQEHSPVICSQSSRTAPRGSQLQAEGVGWGVR